MLRTIATLLSLSYANAQPASPYRGIGSGKASGSQNAKCHEDPLGIFSFWNEHCLYENNVQNKKRICVEVNDMFIDSAIQLVELVISSNAPKMRNSRSLAHNDVTEAEKLSACLLETANEVRMDSFCQKVRHAVGLAFVRVGDVLSKFSGKLPVARPRVQVSIWTAKALTIPIAIFRNPSTSIPAFIGETVVFGIACIGGGYSLGFFIEPIVRKVEARIALQTGRHAPATGPQHED